MQKRVAEEQIVTRGRQKKEIWLAVLHATLATIRLNSTITYLPYP